MKRYKHRHLRTGLPIVSVIYIETYLLILFFVLSSCIV